LKILYPDNCANVRNGNYLGRLLINQATNYIYIIAVSSHQKSPTLNLKPISDLLGTEP